jgi:hypothetical protein
VRVQQGTRPRITRLAQDGRGRLHVFWLSLGRFLGSECPANACVSTARVSWRRGRIVVRRTRVLARSNSAAGTPEQGLAAAAGPRGHAAVVYTTSGDTVRLVRTR